MRVCHLVKGCKALAVLGEVYRSLSLKLFPAEGHSAPATAGSLSG